MSLGERVHYEKNAPWRKPVPRKKTLRAVYVLCAGALFFAGRDYVSSALSSGSSMVRPLLSRAGEMSVSRRERDPLEERDVEKIEEKGVEQRADEAPIVSEYALRDQFDDLIAYGLSRAASFRLPSWNSAVGSVKEPVSVVVDKEGLEEVLEEVRPVVAEEPEVIERERDYVGDIQGFLSRIGSSALDATWGRFKRGWDATDAGLEPVYTDSVQPVLVPTKKVKPSLKFRDTLRGRLESLRYDVGSVVSRKDIVLGGSELGEQLRYDHSIAIRDLDRLVGQYAMMYGHYPDHSGIEEEFLAAQRLRKELDFIPSYASRRR